jgi:hypothetical protein
VPLSAARENNHRHRAQTRSARSIHRNVARATRYSVFLLSTACSRALSGLKWAPWLSSEGQQRERSGSRLGAMPVVVLARR